MFEALLDLMSRALEGLQSLPWGVHALIALGMAAGLVLWLVGQRMLKPLLVMLIGLVGAMVGAMILPASGLSVWHGIGFGLVGGLLVGLLLYRSAMAVGFGLVLGAALPLIAASVLQFYPVAGTARETAMGGVEGAWSDIERRMVQASDAAPRGVSVLLAAGGLGDGPAASLGSSWMHEGAGAPVDLAAGLASAEQMLGAAGLGSEGRDDGRGRESLRGWRLMTASQEPEADVEVESAMPENLAPVADRIRTCWSTMLSEAKAGWSSMPRPHQAIVGLAGVLGLALGVIAGLALPGWAASTVTALFGAAIWLPCFVWLSNAFSAPWRTSLDRSPAAWLAIWGGVAFVGMVVQWSGWLGKPAKGGGKGKPAAG